MDRAKLVDRMLRMGGTGSQNPKLILYASLKPVAPYRTELLEETSGF